MAGDLRIVIGSLLILVGGLLLVSGLLDVALVFYAPEAGGSLRAGLTQVAVAVLLIVPPLAYGFRSLREGARARRRGAD